MLEEILYKRALDMPPLKRQYVLYRDYSKFTHDKLKKILNIPQELLIDLDKFSYTYYDALTIKATLTKMECGILEYENKTMTEMVDIVIAFNNQVCTKLTNEYLINLSRVGIFNDSIVDTCIMDICYRELFYFDNTETQSKISDIGYCISKMKSAYQISVLVELRKKLTNVNQLS